MRGEGVGGGVGKGIKTNQAPRYQQQTSPNSCCGGRVARSCLIIISQMITKTSDKIAYPNSADPDQTAPEGAV